jgi:tetratricopeptide (TPR) repeat protein
MVGTIHMQLGQIDEALDALHSAMDYEQKTEDQQHALGYEIANAYEQKLMPQQALEYFEWLASVCPDYHDPRGNVGERIRRLRTQSGAQRRPSPPSGEPVAGGVDVANNDSYRKP